MKLLDCPTPSAEDLLDSSGAGRVIDLTLAISIEGYFSLKKMVAERGWVWHTSSMANQPAPDKKHLTLRMPRVLHARLKKLAKKRGETVTEVALSIMHKAVDSIELTPAEFRQIADEIEKARRKG